MAEVSAVVQQEREETDIIPEGRILLDMIRHPFVAEKPNEGHHQIMKAILARYPEVLNKITETLKQGDLPNNEKRYYRILDGLYGVSTGQPLSRDKVAKLEFPRVSGERIRQLRNKGLRFLRKRIMLDTEEGPVSLNRIKQELALKLPLPAPR